MRTPMFWRYTGTSALIKAQRNQHWRFSGKYLGGPADHQTNITRPRSPLLRYRRKRSSLAVGMTYFMRLSDRVSERRRKLGRVGLFYGTT